MTSESEVFYDVISSSITILVSSAVVDLEPSLSAMAKMSWDSVDKVGDASEYVATVKSVLENTIPVTRNTLASVYFRGFCDRFASVFLPRFSENIFKCKNVNEMAAQQLLLDTNAVKDLILSIPTLGLDEEAAEKIKQSKRSILMNVTFMKLVNQSFSKTEVLIKIIGSSKTGLVDSFKMLWYVLLFCSESYICDSHNNNNKIHRPHGTAQDLQRIMEVKGMTTQEQKECIEKSGLEFDDKISSSAVASSPTNKRSVSKALRGNVKNTAEAFASMFNFRNT